jgi:hypothetical protein
VANQSASDVVTHSDVNLHYHPYARAHTMFIGFSRHYASLASLFDEDNRLLAKIRKVRSTNPLRGSSSRGPLLPRLPLDSHRRLPYPP